MRINEYRDDLTLREDGKEKANVAQVGELLKMIDRDFGGALYILIWLRGWKARALQVALLVAAGLLVFKLATACPTAVIEVYQGGKLVQTTEVAK